MRIVQVVLSLDIGGQEHLVVRIARALHERGHDAHVVVLSRGGALRGELGPVPVHEVPRGAGFDRTLHARLWRLLRALRPDAVHTHNAAPLIFAAPSARAALVPSVVHTKHGDFAYPSSTLTLARVASHFVDHFVAVSPETSEAARLRERPPSRRLSVVENGIPLGAFGADPAARAAVRAELGVPDDAIVIGSVGRLVPEKDYPLLVRAATPLLSERVRLVIVGEGRERAAIEAAIAPSLRSFVTLTGARRDVPRVLAAFDLFASSSRTEGLPLAIPEAMASGLPIVATAVGGVPGIVPRAVGVLVPYGEPEALTTAVEAFVADADRRRRAAEAARRYARERFGEDRMLEQYLARYRATRRRHARGTT